MMKNLFFNQINKLYQIKKKVIYSKKFNLKKLIIYKIKINKVKLVNLM